MDVFNFGKKLPEKLQGYLSALYGWWKFSSWKVQLCSVHVLFLEIVDLLVASCDGRCVKQNVARHHIMYILSTSVECCIFRHLQHLVWSSIKAMSTSCWNHFFCVFLLIHLSVKLPTHNVTFIITWLWLWMEPKRIFYRYLVTNQNLVLRK